MMAMLLIATAVVPALEEAQAKNFISSFRDKGTWGEIKSEGKSQGNGGSGGGGCEVC